MIAQITLLVTVLSAFGGESTTLALKEKCGLESITSHEINLYLNSKRNETGKWQTSFSVHTDSTNKSFDDGMVLDLKQVVIKCGDKELLQVRGVLGQDATVKAEGETKSPKEKLFFEKGGDNIEFSNERLTATRKNGDSVHNKGSAITNRPLKDKELFEVRIDAKNTKWSGGMKIGLTTLTPSAIKFEDWLLDIKSGTLVYYQETIYHNGSESQAKFGTDLSKLKVGDRVGVMKEADGTVRFFVNGVEQGTVTTKMTGAVYGVVDAFAEVTQVGDRLGVLRKSSGHLHFYVNGEDQGSAAQNIPSNVYGVFELYGSATQATITAPL